MKGRQAVLIVAAALVAGLVGGVVSSSLLIGTRTFAQKTPQPEKLIQAESFELVDKEGKVFLLLSLDSNGPILNIRNKDGEAKIVLNFLSDGSPILALSGKGNSSIFLAMNGEKPDLKLQDKNGEIRARLGLSENGEPVLWIADRAGKPRAVLSMDGSPGLALYDQAEKLRAVLHVMIHGEPSLDLFDKDEKPRAALGYTMLEVPRTGATENRAVSSLVLFDKNGKVIWQAP